MAKTRTQRVKEVDDTRKALKELVEKCYKLEEAYLSAKKADEVVPHRNLQITYLQKVAEKLQNDLAVKGLSLEVSPKDHVSNVAYKTIEEHRKCYANSLANLESAVLAVLKPLKDSYNTITYKTAALITKVGTLGFVAPSEQDSTLLMLLKGFVRYDDALAADAVKAHQPAIEALENSLSKAEKVAPKTEADTTHTVSQAAL